MKVDRQTTWNCNCGKSEKRSDPAGQAADQCPNGWLVVVFRGSMHLPVQANGGEDVASLCGDCVSKLKTTFKLEKIGPPKQ